MTTSSPPPQPALLCPICLDFIGWPEPPLFQRVDDSEASRWEEVDLSGINNEVKYADARRRCYVRCPNPSFDTGEHFLPVSHRDHGDPIIIGLVGRGQSGKTHLLVAMMSEALRAGLAPFGLELEPADEFRNLRFMRNVEKLAAGDRLDGTRGSIQDFAAYYVVRTRSGTSRPLVFFDVAGEDFMSHGNQGRNARFLLGATALMFVEDPEHAVPDWYPDHRSPDTQQNQAFAVALSRLRSRGDIRRIPVAVVVTKADELRYTHPVDRWLRRYDTGPDSLTAFREESRDVYAFLHHYGAHPLLDVYDRFDRGTLHVVSATGSRADGNGYPRVRPMRVLRPLVALLAMVGVVEDPAADGVGR
ncbi:hypothetical protein GCM10022243_38170 [Saccharothrix violaceirubra]|uniref:Double-GTPase 2 domain-containing protein n=1 Tax=Saccharothrix violaceirubra TaxID=413306 RepID=A0A7W7T469_9PSEU|nr:hypothetical protein [Saccharothrix violaceirubra]MBB4966269.1 hypothetical protein [Saccharothrix violaceirubra]